MTSGSAPVGAKGSSVFNPCQQFLSLLEVLPGVCFFAKDAESRIIAASTPMWKRFGMKSEEEILGKTDHDFFPPHIAEEFIRDDHVVMKLGKPLISRVEVLFDENRILDWYATNKFPLYDLVGNIIGVMGTTHSMEEKRGSVFSNVRISKAVQRIQSNFADRLSIADLAAHSSLSERQFRRQFHEIFEMSPQEFILKTRIQAACKVLKQGEAPISDVAIDCGFCDQSSFTHQFRKYLGITPLQFRKGLLKSPSTGRDAI
jgi:AraC-like DNA-binding protein